MVGEITEVAMFESVSGFAFLEAPKAAAKAAGKAVARAPLDTPFGLDYEAIWRDHSGLIVFSGFALLILLIGGGKWLRDLPSNRRAKKGGPTLEPRQVEELMSGSGPLIMDLRSPSVFMAKPGHIRGSVNIPLAILAREIDRFDPAEKRPVVLVDATDELSHRAFLLLKAKGFGWVYVLKGGMKAWKRDGLPMYR
jgi:rhodanese-related sulfurtransferase